MPAVKTLALAASALVFAAGWEAAPRDILDPWGMPVWHEAVLEVPPELAHWEFVVAPVQGLQGVAAVTPGQRFSFSDKYGTRLYAVRSLGRVPAILEDWWKRAQPSGALPFRETRSVPVGSPIRRIVSRARVVEITATEVRMVKAGEERFDARGAPLRGGYLIYSFIGLAGVVLLGVVWKRARPPCAG
jgi:hypothetical protein